MITDTQRPTATIAERLADYVVGLRYEDLPTPVVDRAKELLVFNLGLALRGTGLRGARQAVQAAFDLTGHEGGECSIVGEARKASLLDAAFANSALGMSAGIIDLLFPSGVVPGQTVHPAAWTVGEKVRASGQQLVTALVAGHDVMAKLHDGRLPYDLTVPRPTKAVVEPFGVAATAASLLGLDREQTVNAMGHAGQLVSSIYEGTKSQPLMHPFACRSGVLAAMLARSGLPGARTIIEGPQGIYRTYFVEDVPESVRASLGTLGEDFEITKVRRTRYPVSLANTLPMDLTQRLAREHHLTPERVAAIELVLPRSREARERIYGVYAKGPTTVVAIALTDGRLDSARLEKELGADLLAVRDKVRLRFEDDRGFFYARVEITDVDGQRHTAEGDEPVDSPPIDWADWLAAGETVVTKQQLTQLADLIRHLETVPDVSELMACVVPSRS
jgi:2-methylcitrate dehydratase PrpD